MVEKIRCPYCNLQIEPGTQKCPSCGYLLEQSKTEKKEDAVKKNHWQEVEELYKKYAKQEKKIDEETVRAWIALEEIAKQKAREKAQKPPKQKPVSQVAEPRKWESLEKEVKKAPPQHQLQPVPAQVTSMREKTKTNGLSTKHYDARKRFFAEKKVRKKLFLIPLLFSLILILSTSLFMYSILTEKKIRVKIDGNFDDWDYVSKFRYFEQTTSVNPNINITSAAIWEDEKTMFVYIHVEGNALYGNNVNRTDEFFLFLDSDKNAATGYLVNGLGADYMVRITGISGKLLSSSLYIHTQSQAVDKHTWNAWQYIGGVSCAVSGSQIEVGISKAMLSASNVPVLIVAHSFTGESDATSYPLISGNAVFLTEVYQLPLLASENEVKVSTCYVKIIGEPNVRGVVVEGPSTPVDASIEYRGERTRLRFEQNLSMTMLGASFTDGEYFSIYAKTSGLAEGSLLWLKVRSIEVSNGYFWMRSEGTNSRTYVRSPPEGVVIDGAFGDWANVKSAYDDTDAQNPSIDLRQAAQYFSQNSEAFFYVRVSANAFAGTFVPEQTPDYSPISIERDSDRDSIPDAADPFPFDFNNDGIDDAQTQNDVDGDGIKDYPYGNDYYLNTTIPDDPRFPAEARGKKVSIYIGPIVEPTETIAGLDYLRVYVDTDRNASTGCYVGMDTGAEILLEVSGREGEIRESAFYEWNGKWEKAGSFEAKGFGAQVEFGGVKIPANAKCYILATDWAGESDSLEMKAMAMRNTERLFDTNIRVNTVTAGWQIWPDLAYDGEGTIYAVWEGNETGNSAIYFSKSIDGGLTWSTAQKIPYSDNGSSPAIAVYGRGSSAIVHVVFVGSALGGGGVYPDLYYARSTDGGNSFTTTVLDGDYYSEHPDICVDSMGYVYVVYTNWFFLFDADVKLKVSTNMGQSFGSSFSIAHSGYNEYLPAVAVQGSGPSSTLHVLYTYEHYNESGNERYDTDVIYCKVSNAGSSPSVGSPVTVAGYVNKSEYSISNSIAVDSLGNIHAVYTFNWSEYDYDIYYARSTDGGNTFTKKNLVDYSTYDEYEPRIAIDDENNPHIVWQDNRSGNYDIWYTYSSDNGQTFLPYSQHIKVNKDATTQSQACATILFVNAQNARKELCVAWADKRSGDYDIYFANGTNRVFLTVNSQYGTPSGTGWYAAGSTARASVDSLVYESSNVRHVCTGFTGTGSAPSSGTTNATAFTIYLPSNVTFTWRIQYFCQITFTGTDAQHTVNGSYVENGTTHNIAGLVGSWAGWCDENTLLYFHYVTSPQQNYTTDPHSWIVTYPITAVIHYSSQTSELSTLLPCLAILAILCFRIGLSLQRYRRPGQTC